jgi:Cdc6-like AAA superfamily ATPase
MDRTEAFAAHINEGYFCKGDSIILGGPILNGVPLTNAYIRVPLKTMNRHSLIAGATGTGKTKTLQVISEQLSERGVPVVKVLTSATFIRGVLGILKKVM